MSAAEWIEARSRLALRPWQRAAVGAMFPDDGSPSQWETFLISTVKKTGKTTLNAWATLYGALHFPPKETAYVIANDQEQADENTFTLIVDAVREAGLEASGAAKVLSDRITFPETGTRIIAIPADFAGSAGARFGITSWTEAWAYRYESHVRLWEELTVIPNRRSLRIVDSYAGYSADSPVLEPLWQRALAGERLSDDLPIFANGKLWAYIDQGEEAQRRGWLGDPAEMESYYAEQRASLRPGTFNRLHLNQWQSGEEAFVTAEAWDACEVAERPTEVSGPVYLGLDAAVKHDCAAVVAVAREGEHVRLVAHRIWKPRLRRPIDLEVVEDYVVELSRRHKIAAVVYDPYQFVRSAGVLRGAGIRTEELPQSSGNLTAAGQALYDLIQERRLIAYRDKELRAHVLNAVAVHSSRGWRLAKEKASRKIDACVALSFASLAAVRKSEHGGKAESAPSFLEPGERWRYRGQHDGSAEHRRWVAWRWRVTGEAPCLDCERERERAAAIRASREAEAARPRRVGGFNIYPKGGRRQ